MSDASTSHKKHGFFSDWYRRRSRKTKFTFWFVLLWPIFSIISPVNIPMALFSGLIEFRWSEAEKRESTQKYIRQAKDSALVYMYAKAKYRNPSIVLKKHTPDDCELSERYFFVYKYYEITCIVNGAKEVFYDANWDNLQYSYISLMYVIHKNRSTP